MRFHFWERRGCWGYSSARGWWRRRRPVGLLEEEDDRSADRMSPPVSEREAVGQAGPEGGRETGGSWLGWKGGGREVGHGWAGNRKWQDKILSNFYLDFGFLANFENLHKEILK
jgi:hypothetical protein